MICSSFDGLFNVKHDLERRQLAGSDIPKLPLLFPTTNTVTRHQLGPELMTGGNSTSSDFYHLAMPQSLSNPRQEEFGGSRSPQSPSIDTSILMMTDHGEPQPHQSALSFDQPHVIGKARMAAAAPTFDPQSVLHPASCGPQTGLRGQRGSSKLPEGQLTYGHTGRLNHSSSVLASETPLGEQKTETQVATVLLKKKGTGRRKSGWKHTSYNVSVEGVVGKEQESRSFHSKGRLRSG